MDDVEAFRRAQLRCAVMDPPWDTSLAWADGYGDLPGREDADVDRVVRAVLLSMLDDGLVYFYEAESFGEEYSREVPEADGLAREVVAKRLAGETKLLANGTRQVPFLVFRATEKGREHHFQLCPSDRP